MNNENNSKTTSIVDLRAKLRKSAEYRKAERKIRPLLNIASDIIRLRTQKGYTQTTLANAAHTHQSRISKIESGDHDLRISTLVQIAEALNCELYLSFCAIEDYDYYGDRENYEVLIGQHLNGIIESKEDNTKIFDETVLDFQEV